MNEKAIRQYLERHAEPEAALLNNFPREYRQVIVIPAHREQEYFLVRLQKLAEDKGEIVAILVINRPDNHSIVSQDQALWDAALTTGQQVWRRDSLCLVEWGNASNLLLVDRFSADREIPAQQGVGLARKIGCDIALALCAQGNLQTDFIHSSDADAELPADYFDRTAEHGSASALLYPFSHIPGDDPAINQATALYERSLNYYVDGLRWAGSPYAFHTIGSCLAVSPRHYAQARGFPRRAGGEDFYLLNKLAKLAPVITLQGSPIRLQARTSDRVPFGTGPAVAKICALESLADFSTYAPEIFVELAQLLRGFELLWEKRHDCAGWLSQFPLSTQAACRSLGIEALFLHLQKQARNEHQCLNHAHRWFDGFRTLKFVHYLQSHYYPAIPLSDALDRAAQLWTPEIQGVLRCQSGN